MIGAIAGAAAAITAAGWHSMSPRSQLYGRTFIGLKRRSRMLALTFDDGPSERWTPRLLDVLARHDVRATFFMIGRHVASSPALARRVAEAGHLIGNHTYTHPNLIFVSRSRLVAELEQCRRTMQDALGDHSRLFRPPFGARRPDVLATARRLGYVPVMWRVAGNDWKRISAEQVEARVARQVRGGDVILLHDGGHLTPDAERSATVDATDRLIIRYKAQGYRFVTVTEMMNAE